MPIVNEWRKIRVLPTSMAWSAPSVKSSGVMPRSWVKGRSGLPVNTTLRMVFGRGLLTNLLNPTSDVVNEGSRCDRAGGLWWPSCWGCWPEGPGPDDMVLPPTLTPLLLLTSLERQVRQAGSSILGTMLVIDMWNLFGNNRDLINAISKINP